MHTAEISIPFVVSLSNHGECGFGTPRHSRRASARQNQVLAYSPDGAMSRITYPATYCRITTSSPAGGHLQRLSLSENQYSAPAQVQSLVRRLNPENISCRHVRVITSPHFRRRPFKLIPTIVIRNSQPIEVLFPLFYCELHGMRPAFRKLTERRNTISHLL